MLPRSIHLGSITLPLNLPLSPITSYYLQRLLQHHGNHWVLKPVPELIPTDPIAAVRQLEQLTLKHQALSNDRVKHLPSLRQTEAEIFRLLGFHIEESQPEATILIVDDTPEVLRVFSEVLTHQGYEVCSAISGTIALNHATQIQPDLILLDIMMSGIDGYDVCERLKANPDTAEIPIIFISAIHEPFDKVKAFSLGCVDYLTKPIQIEELLVRIEHHLTLHRLQTRLTTQTQQLQQEFQAHLSTIADYRHFFEQAVDGLYQVTPDGQFLQVNPALATLLGYDTPLELQESVGYASQLYARPTRWTELLHYLQQYGSVRDFESQMLSRDGRLIWVSESVHAVKDNDGWIVRLEGIVRDITDRTQQVEHLLHQHSQQEHLWYKVLLQLLTTA